MKTAELLNEWLTTYERERVKPRTYARYEGLINLHTKLEGILEDGCLSQTHILAPAFLHRRIVVAYRLRQLGSANSLLPAVSLR